MRLWLGVAHRAHPDGNAYPELISSENEDLAGFRVASGVGLPHGLDEGNTYRMRRLPENAALHQIKIVDRSGRFDGLDLANIAGVKLLFRRLQLIEYFWSEKGPGGGKAGGKGGKQEER